jgi:GT2 family glycosyltransferase
LTPAAPGLDFSVVVVTWECADLLAGLVESMNGNLSSETELVVVDNGSRDDPAAVAESWRGPSSFERLEQNRGFGVAANRGVELASRESIVVVNPDTQLLDDRLPALARFAVERGCLAGPRLRNPDGSVQPSAAGDPVGWWPWLGAIAPGVLLPHRLVRRTEPWRLEVATRVAWISGACVAGPRRAMLELGPFDPSIDMYAEDMDLGLRAARAGVPTWFCPELTQVMHRRRGSSERRWPGGPEAAAAASRRQVLSRLHGPRVERRAWLAERVRLRLRVWAKRALRRSAAAEARELAALRSAPPAGGGPGSPR